MSQGPRPNILWISLEDCSPRLGCYGDPMARTPNIDAFAGGAMRYTQAFATAPVCAPSRCSIITGVYAGDIGAQHQRVSSVDPELPGLPTPYTCVPPSHIKAFSEQLRTAGYFCTNNGKCDYQFSTRGAESPLTAWDLCGQPEDLEEVHWRKRAAGQPFFAVFNLDATHESGMWRKDGERLVTDPAAVAVPSWLPDDEGVRRCIARQYDNLARNDEIAGVLLRQLEEDGLLDNTIVVIWSDHGEGLPRSKRFLYDSGLRVPLIVRRPGAASGVSDRLVSLIDLAPTMLSLCGLSIPRHLQGQIFTGSGESPREYIFATRDRLDGDHGRMRAVRNRRYKYIRNFQPEKQALNRVEYTDKHEAWKSLRQGWLRGTLDPVQAAIFSAPRPAEELYDTQADPDELQNLAGDVEHMNLMDRLRRRLESWMLECDRCGERPEEAMAREFWPAGQIPATAAVVVFISGEWAPSLQVVRHGMRIRGPAAVTLACGTPGASISLAVNGEAAKLYTGQVKLEPGTNWLRAAAVRYGFAQSREVELRIDVE